VLTPFDDYPIHSSALPVGVPASGDPNHYDRYFFNGHPRDGSWFVGAAMGHYPWRGVIDAAFCIVHEGVEHSLFASGTMPNDRSTEVGPIRVEVVDPMRTIRLVVDENEHRIACDLTFRHTTPAIEEPRQIRHSPEGVVLTDHTRLTQWGTWEGTIVVDDVELVVDPTDVTGARDRSWGVRPVGEQLAHQRPTRIPSVFWLWAPLHFDDWFTHLALHENPDGSRWLETALLLDPIAPGSPPWEPVGVTECGNIRYRLQFEPGTRDMREAELWFDHPEHGEMHVELEKRFTFRMRGLGYTHPTRSHGKQQGQLSTLRESIALTDFDPTDFASIHLQNVVVARMAGRTGVGVLEQFHMGPHEPTGLTGFIDGSAG
jgi:hypothetical protein